MNTASRQGTPRRCLGGSKPKTDENTVVQIEAYLKSITDECNALKNRVRNFIENAHWATDGAWKESVLRSIISRTIPSNYSVASGFVVTDSGPSTQIDILIYDNSVPVLYKGGDLVFVPPSACAALIEVKARLNQATFLEAATKLADNSERVSRYEPHRRLFSGVFSYDFDGTGQRLLEHIDAAAQGSENRIVNHVSLGESSFIKYWPTGPNFEDPNYESWHQYALDRTAPGYFVHNLMSHLAGEDLIRGNNVWFPREGKELRRQRTRRLSTRLLDVEAG